MRFTLSSTALNAKLQTLSKVISNKNSLPILESFLLRSTTANSSSPVQTVRMS